MVEVLNDSRNDRACRDLGYQVRESVVETHLVKRVQWRGGEVRKVTWQGRRGAPDRLVMLPVQTGFTPTYVELKAPGKVPTVSQVREHMRLRAMGCRVVVIDSIDGVDKLLEGY